MGISGVTFRVGGGEDGVHQHKSANNLGDQSSADGVAIGNPISPAAVLLEVGLLEGLDKPNSTDGPQTLGHHVHHGSHK